MTSRRRLRGVLLCALAAASVLHAQDEPVLIDRVLAVVDEDPILQSEVEQVVGLKMIEAAPDEEERSLRRRALDQLIEQRLRFHEIDSFGFVEMSPDAVEEAFAAVRARFASDEEFAARLEALGLSTDSLRQLVARQLMVLTYVDERLGPRVFVDLDDIRAYYDETLVPRLKSEGAEPPPLQQVREQIRAVLKEERLNAEIESWTEELRRQADVEDYFDEVEGEMPGVVAASAAPKPG